MDWTPALATVLALAPGLSGFALSRLTRASARRARRLTRAGTLVAFLLAIGLAGIVFGTPEGAALAAGDGLRLEGPLGLALSLRIDGLTVLMALTVGLIAHVVARFSERYLDGDPDQARFCQWLAFTSSAALLLVVSGDLLMLFAAWVAANHGLDALLLHRRDRPGALRTARARRFAARLGELCLVAVLAVSHLTFGSFDLAVVLGSAAAPEHAAAVSAIALLLVVAAMTMSVQLPFHGWLPDSMETPTPVSALMHAGLVNAGGFLLVRMSPLIVQAPWTLALLAVVGAMTAVSGAFVLTVQTDIKRKYAWSTISQMGFMMLQCGLGAFSAAALHLVGHSFYKGHAFLSAASQVDPRVPLARPDGSDRPDAAAVAIAVVAGLAAIALPLWLLGIGPADKPGLLVLGAILAMAVAQVVLLGAVPRARGGSALVESLLLGAAFSALYFLGLAGFDRALVGVVPAQTVHPVGATLQIGLVALFALAFVAQLALARSPEHPWARAAWVHASNGFYLDSIRMRLLGRLGSISPSSIAHETAHEGGR